MPNPYLINVHELVDRPGESRELDVVLPAEAELAVALARVEEEAPIAAHLLLESVHEGILVTAQLDYRVDAESAIDLEPLSWDEHVEFRELFAYHAVESSAADESSDADARIVRQDHVDLRQSVRDAIVLQLPFKPKGAEQEFGVASFGPPDEPDAEQDLDPRWQALLDAQHRPDDPGTSK